MKRQLAQDLLSASGADDPRADALHARAAVRRGQRVLWLLAGISTISWLVACGALVAFYAFFVTMLLPRIHEALSRPFDPQLTPGVWQTTIRAMLFFSQPMVWTSAIAAALGVSATVALVLYGRHVTVRQIGLSLREISRQLDELRDRQAPGAVDTEKK